MKLRFCALLILPVFVFASCSGSDEPVTESTVSGTKNIILLIGDGMGISQVYAAMTVNKDPLNLERCPYVGFQKTYSANNYVTDSAAGATAIASGEKTNNEVIGQDVSGNNLTSILEIAEKHGLATGLVSTSSITHATPASFIAHQPHRDMYEEIAADFLQTEIDVIIGGGRDHFVKRRDNRDLLQELKQKGYSIVSTIEEVKGVASGKLVALTTDKHLPKYAEGRGDFLPLAARHAIRLLSQNEKGFFLMIEGSQIDWGGHDKDIQYIVEEMIDFDKTIGEVLDFAAKDGNTLVVITADHETGGLALTDGSIENGEVTGEFITDWHTGVMVPIFAYGPGAENFTGIFDNTGFKARFLEYYGLEE